MERGVWLVLATAAISGVSVFLNRFAVAGLDPAFFTTAKNVVVAVLLLSTALLLRERKVLSRLKAKTWGALALIGLIGGSIPFLLFFTGLKLTTAAQGALIHKTMFVWVAVLAYFALKERVDRRIVAAGALLLLGNILLLRLTGYSPQKGDLLIFAATLFWAAEITLSRRVLTSVKALPGRVVALGRMGFGSLFLLAYLVATGKAGLFAATTAQGWLWIALTSALLYGYVFTFYEGLKTVPAATATALLLLGSVVTTLLSFVATRNMTGLEIAGTLLILAGASIALRPQARASSSARDRPTR